MKFKINHRISGSVLFSAETETFRACVELAVKSGANLSDAYLRGANLSGANLSGAIGIADVLSVGPIGSRRDYVTATVTDAGVRVSTGCFAGTLDEFRAAVDATHSGNEHGIHYRAAISLIELRFGIGGAL